MTEKRSSFALPATASDRRRVELVGLGGMLAITAMYCIGAYTGLFDVTGWRRTASITWIVVVTGAQTCHVLRYRLRGRSLPFMNAISPMIDPSSITAAWLALGDRHSVLWSVYFFALVSYSRRRKGRAYIVAASFILLNLVGGAITLNVTNGYPPVDANVVILTVVGSAIALLASSLSRAWRRSETRAMLLASIDPLTGIANRRSFFADADAYAAVAGGRFGLLMIDIDDFKSVNDTQGHLMGDAVLTRVAGALRATLRPQDIVARYGGEEFVVLLHNAAVSEVMATAERLRAAVVERAAVTVSIGATDRAPGETLEQVIRRADDLLRRAKRAGKNAVQCSGRADAA